MDSVLGLKSFNCPKLWDIRFIRFSHPPRFTSAVDFSRVGMDDEYLGNPCSFNRTVELGLLIISNTSAPSIAIGTTLRIPPPPFGIQPPLLQDYNKTYPSITSLSNVDISANIQLQRTNLCSKNIIGLNINGSKIVVLNATVSCSGIFLSHFEVLIAPDLFNVTGDFIIQDGDLRDLSLPSLTKVGDSFILVNNTQLTNISLANMTNLGGDLVIMNNGPQQVISLPLLQTIEGTVNITGDIQR
ncbi:hypothetical protein DL98DRAFT_600634 [Cadophora sp. DSE1049]|nr:hypothetical protein DL98DRAFT_600634 [Cadophora sp. DSE1049]